MSRTEVLSSPGDETARPDRSAPKRAPRRTVAVWGLFSRRQRWGVSLRGFLVAVVIAVLLGAGALLKIYPFLAVTARTPSEFLTVEGWVHEYAIRTAATEFTSGGYQQVFATGGPVQ